MGYYIYHSNSLNEFVERQSDLFHTNDFFGEKVVTVVQNRNIASWLRLQLANVDGISMDLEVEYPEIAIKKLVAGYNCGKEMFGEGDDSKNLLFMDSLKVVLYKTLEEKLSVRENYPHLYNYVDGSNKRLFQLSDSLAGLFYHYGMNCPGMVASWDRGELYKNSEGITERVKDQTWQIKLWNDLFNNTPYLHISKVLNRVLDSGESFIPENSEYGKCRIILFGSSFLGESAIKFFNYLSKDIDVHHFILTPSEIYSREEDSEPKGLLKLFSGLINGFTAISRDPSFEKVRISYFLDRGSDSLLHSLQTAINSNDFTNIPVTNDGSLKICKVTGGWREIEILKDKIFNLLSSDPTLKLTDIGVVAPDIGYYNSYIEAIFDLPYNIVGLNGGEDSPYIRGILSLLELPGSNFNRKEILNIISNPCFMEKFRLTNGSRELFLKTIDELNIKWAVDGEHKSLLGYKNDSFNTWEEGLKRYLLGITLNREDNPLLPFNLSDTQSVDSIGVLVHIVRSLYSDFYKLNRLKLYMDEWVLLIETLVENYLQPVKGDSYDERERISVKNQYRNILNLLDDLKNLGNFKNREIPYSVFYSLLKEFILKAGNSKGRYLTHGITFSSLKPLRAVPFKHIFVLGLNEDKFPGKESLISYDLRSIYEQKIDLSKRQNDKFAFLELLLSAKDSVTLFYNSKNQVTGEVLQPSVVINELMEVLGDNETLIEEHPLHNFDKKYFNNKSTIFSYNKQAFEAAGAYYGDKIESPLMNLEADRVATDLEISVKDLITFINNPIKQFFNKGEGIYLKENENLEEDIYENREVEFLPKWKFANLALEYGLNSDNDLQGLVDSFFYTARVEGVYKESPLTDNQRESVTEIIGNIETFLGEQDFKTADSEILYKRETRELGTEYTPLEFNINGINVKLTGELEDIWLGPEGELFSMRIMSGYSGKFEAKHLIKAFIYSLIIFSHKEMKEGLFTLYGVGKSSYEPHIFKESNDSLSILEGIIELYIKNMRNPVPFFPDFYSVEDGETFKEFWEKESNNSRSFSAINSCPYVKFLYKESIPELLNNDITGFKDKIYSFLVEDKKQ